MNPFRALHIGVHDKVEVNYRRTSAFMTLAQKTANRSSQVTQQVAAYQANPSPANENAMLAALRDVFAGNSGLQLAQQLEQEASIQQIANQLLPIGPDATCQQLQAANDARYQASITCMCNTKAGGGMIAILTHCFTPPMSRLLNYKTASLEGRQRDLFETCGRPNPDGMTWQF